MRARHILAPVRQPSLKAFDGDRNGGANTRARFNCRMRHVWRMQPVIVLDKADRQFTRLIELLRSSPEVRLADIEKAIPRSVYYGSVVRKLLKLNKALR